MYRGNLTFLRSLRNTFYYVIRRTHVAFGRTGYVIATRCVILVHPVRTGDVSDVIMTDVESHHDIRMYAS